MTEQDASIFLKRAFGLLKEVENKTEELRARVVSHAANLDESQPFLQGLWAGFSGARRIGAEKAELIQDLQLAAAEVEKSSSIDPDARIETGDGFFNSLNLRAAIFLLYGQVEMVWGSPETARQQLEQSLQAFELPETYFMLGALHESQYDAPTALRHFEKYLELDPTGEFSVSALRAANQMRNYRKHFRGDWGLLVISFFVCFPVAPIYFFKKYK